MTLDGISVRFFVCELDVENDDPIFEVDEARFREECDAGATIKYERHTVYANGVSQICLTAWQE